MPAHLDKTKTKEEAAVVSFPSDGSLIAAVFFGRKSTADTATRPSALLLSKSKSNNFVVVDFEFYLLRSELQPRRPFHCVNLADWSPMLAPESAKL